MKFRWPETLIQLTKEDNLEDEDNLENEDDPKMRTTSTNEDDHKI